MKLSLAGWSLQKLFWAKENALKLVDFPAFTRDTFGLHAIELNNHFFESTRPPYLDQLRLAAESAGVEMLNIAVDEHGELSSFDSGARAIALANYSRWIHIAAYLGVKAVRANSGGVNAPHHKAAVECCVDSFRRLCDIGRPYGVQVLIENHTGLSFDPAFVVELVRRVRLTHGDDAIAVLADFGNWPDSVDRYAALAEVLPYASAVHAKVNDIDDRLRHHRFDHARCVDLCREAGYDGYLGIEYEGDTAEPIEGVRRGIRRLRQILC
ncbi:MAG TPA: sugar phosphate isomerase/epimerase family protein [Tepidisphaeraceae bacterium]|jgi:sugar phosphate isomerase/epimerase